MNLSDFLNITIAQALQWLVTAGVAAGVAYALEWLDWDETVEKIIGAVATAMLIAGVVAMQQFIPTSWLGMKLIDAAFAIAVALAAIVGGWKFGAMKAETQFIELRASRAFDTDEVKPNLD